MMDPDLDGFPPPMGRYSDEYEKLSEPVRQGMKYSSYSPSFDEYKCDEEVPDVTDGNDVELGPRSPSREQCFQVISTSVCMNLG